MVDALRGWALLGILLVNMSYFIGWWDSSPGVRNVQWGNKAAPAVAFLLEWLVAGKFYSLFSLLFGTGFAIQIERLAASRASLGIYVRRMLILFLFGIAHTLSLWMGDILALYAIVGLVLLLFRRANDRTLLISATAAAIAPVIWSIGITFGGYNPTAPFSALGMATFEHFHLEARSVVSMWADPHYSTHLKGNVGELFFNFSNLLFELRPAKILSMFLVGYWAGRKMVGLELSIPNNRLRKVQVIGFTLGLPLSAISALLAVRQLTGISPPERFLAEISSSVGTPAMALAYAATFVRLWRNGPCALLAAAAPAGRMALTNYLMQSAIQCILFFGWGFGLVGKVSITFVPLIGGIIFAMQILVSTAWLQRFRMGPFEWLWRSLTVGEPIPMGMGACSGDARD